MVVSIVSETRDAECARSSTPSRRQQIGSRPRYVTTRVRAPRKERVRMRSGTILLDLDSVSSSLQLYTNDSSYFARRKRGAGKNAFEKKSV